MGNKTSIDAENTAPRLTWRIAAYGVLMLACAACSAVVFRMGMPEFPEPARSTVGAVAALLWCWAIGWLAGGLFWAELSGPETVACLIGCWALSVIGVLNGVTVWFTLAGRNLRPLHGAYVTHSIPVGMGTTLAALALVMVANVAVNAGIKLYYRVCQMWQRSHNGK